MAVNGWLAADSDMHVMEPADLWQRYMDPRWGHAIPVGLEEIERDMRVKVKNEVLLRLGPMRPQAGRPRLEAGAGLRLRPRRGAPLGRRLTGDGHGDGTPRLRRVLPEPGSLRPGHAERRAHRAQRARAGAGHGHRPGLQRLDGRLRGSDCERPGRVFGAAMLAPHDVSSAVDELARNVERGFVAAFLAPGLVDNKPWHDRSTTRCGARPSASASRSASTGGA